jgi:signal transduction histidine kinase
MKFIRATVENLGVLKRSKIDRASLQFRLTLGITVASILGLGSIGTWTIWEMRQMLVVQHQNSLESIANRLPHDFEATNSNLPVDARLQSTLNDWSSSDQWIWVVQPDGSVMARSTTLPEFLQATASTPFTRPMNEAEVHLVGGHYLVLCSRTLQANGKTLGKMYLAQDITHDYTVLTTLVRSLIGATILAIATIAAFVALFIWRSLHPLRTMNRLVSVPSPDTLATLHPGMEQVPSEVKEFVQAFNTLSVQLFEAGEKQRQFTNNISHELRTSLCLVYGYLQSTLRRGTNLTDSQKEALGVAVSETEHTIQVLKDLLDLARSNSGSMQFQLERVVLNDLLAEMVNKIEHPNELPIVLEATDAPVVVQADAGQLIRALKQLIDNAVRYSIGIQPIMLRLSQEQNWAVIQVCDRGCGIPPSEQAHIFEPFYRIDSSRCRSTGGVGLGLAIVKSLIEGMGGQVTVQSALDEGSTFTIHLPADTEATASSSAVQRYEPA